MRGTNKGLRSKKGQPGARPHARAGRSCRHTLLHLEELERRVVPSTVTIGASKDNTLYQSTVGNISNGAGGSFYAGLTNRSSIRRGLIDFDVAGNIPAGSTINSVTLTLHVNKENAASPAKTVQLRRVQADWGEGTSVGSGQGALATTNDATWVYRFYNTVMWANQGGDFASAASA